MSKRIDQTHLIQSQVKVAVQARSITSAQLWFVTLAFFFAGVFYFWGYYFWANLWRVLTG